MLAQALGANTPAEKLFIKKCTQFGLNVDDLHRIALNLANNTKYEIAGIVKSNYGPAHFLKMKKCIPENIRPFRPVPALLISIQVFKNKTLWKLID